MTEQLLHADAAAVPMIGCATAAVRMAVLHHTSAKHGGEPWMHGWMCRHQGHTAGSKSCDSKPAMRLSRASTSLLSAAVLGAPCTVEGMGPAVPSLRNVAVLNFSPRAGSSSSTAR